MPRPAYESFRVGEGLFPSRLFIGDCQEKDSLGPGVKDVDLVFHLAGATRAIEAKTYFEVNALGTENLVQACLET